MPFKPKRRKYAKKRSYSAMAVVPAFVPRPVMVGKLQPPAVQVDLTYSQCFHGVSTVQTENKWSLNDPTQPKTASSGHAVRGWTQWKTLYDEYRVDKAVVKITAINRIDKPAIIVFNPNNLLSASISNAREAMEQNGSFGRCLAQQEAQHVTRTYVMSKELGQDYPSSATGVTSSPGEILYLHQAADAMYLNENHDVLYQIIIVMTVTLFTPSDPAKST